MSNESVSLPQSQETAPPPTHAVVATTPQIPDKQIPENKLPESKPDPASSSFRPITQEEINALPEALSSQQKAEKAATEEQAHTANPRRLLKALGKSVETSTPPVEKPTIRDFSNRDFRGFSLRGKDLSSTNFTDSNLREVDLTRADLTGSDLRNASLQHAILEDAILTDVKNLTLRQVGGANLQNIQPSTAVTIDASAQVDEALKNAGKLYLTTISLCIFSILVVLATKDIDIVAGTGQTKLPLVDLQIPTGWFFVLTPALIVITHLTLHLQLLRAWESMLDLPAIYPDGRTVERKVNPMLLNSIVLLHWPRLRGRLSPFTFSQAQLSKLTVYWTAPLALFLFWERDLIKQSSIIAIWHLALLLVASWGGRGMRLLWFCSLRARSQRDTMVADRKAWPGHLAVIALPLLLCGAYYMVLYSPWFEARIKLYNSLVEKNPENDPPLKNKMALFLRERVSAHMAHLQIPAKPSSWIDAVPEGIPPDSDISLTKDKAELKRRQAWSEYLKQFDKITELAQLSNASLRYAHIDHAFLAKADLSGANLIGADLSSANLSSANLIGADLSSANLIQANLNSADLNSADLNSADLNGANLIEANLIEAYLNGADLGSAHLNGADLNSAHLNGAKLMFADLNGANLMFADLNGAWLMFADLSGANLRGVDLSSAYLNGANLNNAKYVEHGVRATKWPPRLQATSTWGETCRLTA